MLKKSEMSESKGTVGELKAKVTPTPLSTSKLKSSSNVNPKPKSKGKVFQCTNFPPCSMSFTRYEHLARHIRKHTGERPFQCDFCNKKFSRLDNLRQHRHTVHSKEVISSQSKEAASAKEQKMNSKGQMERQTLEYPINSLIDQQKLQNLRYQQDPTAPSNSNVQHQMQQQYYVNYPPQLSVGMNAMQIPMIMNNQLPLHHLPNVQRIYSSLSPASNTQMLPLNSNNELQVPYFNSQQQKTASQASNVHQSASNLPPPRNNALLERSSANTEFRPKANKPIPLNINEEISSANALLSGATHNIASGEIDQRDANTYLSNVVTPTTATTNGSISTVANLSSATNMTSFNGSQYSSHLQNQYPMNYSNPQGYQSPYHSSYGKLHSPTTSSSFSNLTSPYTLNFNSYPNSASTTNNSNVTLLNENSKNIYQLQYGYSTNVLKPESDTLSPTTTSYPMDSLKLPSLPQFRSISSQSTNKPSPLGPSFQQNVNDNAAPTAGAVDESEKFANDSNETIKPLSQPQEIIVEASGNNSS